MTRAGRTVLWTREQLGGVFEYIAEYIADTHDGGGGMQTLPSRWGDGDEPGRTSFEEPFHVVGEDVSRWDAWLDFMGRRFDMVAAFRPVGPSQFRAWHLDRGDWPPGRFVLVRVPPPLGDSTAGMFALLSLNTNKRRYRNEGRRANVWSLHGPDGSVRSLTVDETAKFLFPITSDDDKDKEECRSGRRLGRFDEVTWAKTQGLSPETLDRCKATLASDSPKTRGLPMWTLSPRPASLWGRFLATGLGKYVRRTILGFLGQSVLTALAFGLIGAGAMQGRTDPGWITAWILVLATVVWLGFIANSAANRLATLAGGLGRERLLEGILRLPTEMVRKKGVGEFLSDVMEVELAEYFARGGGILGLSAFAELLVTIAVVVASPTVWIHLPCLWAAWLGALSWATGFIGWLCHGPTFDCR